MSGACHEYHTIVKLARALSTAIPSERPLLPRAALLMRFMSIVLTQTMVRIACYGPCACDLASFPSTRALIKLDLELLSNNALL